MKIPLLLAVLACIAPTLSAPAMGQAQTPAATPLARAAAPVEFNFGADFHQLQNHFIWRSLSDDGGGGDEFFAHNSGAQGLPLDEKIALFDANHQAIAVLTATFDAKGKLLKQDLADAQGQIVASQSDFTAGKLAPFSAGRGIAVQTIVVGALLRRRVFTLIYPTWSGTLICDYDERGRRTRDLFSSSNSARPSAVTYSYDEQGLSAISVAPTAETPAIRAQMERENGGQLRQLRAYNDEKLTLISTALRDDKGEFTGTRSENYREGALSGTAELHREIEGDKVTFIFSQSDAQGALTRRQTQVNGLTTSSERFAGGKLLDRVNYDEAGTPKSVTRFKPDGSIQSVTLLDANGNAGKVFK